MSPDVVFTVISSTGASPSGASPVTSKSVSVLPLTVDRLIEASDPAWMPISTSPDTALTSACPATASDTETSPDTLRALMLPADGSNPDVAGRGVDQSIRADRPDRDVA